MKKHLLFLFFLLGIISYFLIIASSSCDKNNSTDIPYDNHIGDTIIIKFNECKSIYDKADNKSFDLCFIEVSDKRCLKSECYVCYGSFAYININWINQNNDSVNLELSVIGCAFDISCRLDELIIDTLNYRFCLMNLFPYPDTCNFPINQNDYQAIIKISKL